MIALGWIRRMFISVGESQTFEEMRNKAMSRAINQITLSGNTDGGKDIVAGTHNLPDIGVVEFINHLGSGWF
jgi:hypothetical protein